MGVSETHSLATARQRDRSVSNSIELVVSTDLRIVRRMHVPDRDKLSRSSRQADPTSSERAREKSYEAASERLSEVAFLQLGGEYRRCSRAREP